ncbi:MAG: hypothetical protein FWE27_08990 [Defluviitaleaceae bacterium]|nr:hypothetical protein [Defluviitaleaceae bacterium]
MKNLRIQFKRFTALFLTIFLILSISLSVSAGTTFIYDDLGRLIEIHRPNGDRTIFTYDQAGNIINVSVITVDAVEIHTADDLNKVRNNLAGSFRLMDDIDMTGVDWLPIGTRTAPFTGVLDGDGFTISNLTIDRPSLNDVGLFGRNSGTIINLGLSNVDITGADNTGAIAGHNSANIIDSYVDGVSVVRGSDNVGGIAGNNSGGIMRTYTTSDVHGNNNVGGFAGFINGGNIDQAYAIGHVNGNNNVGGFVGHLTDAASVIRNAFSTGQVFGASNDAGFAGQIISGRIENSYSLSNNANGFSRNNGGVVENSFFDQDIIETTLAAPEARTTEQMMSESNFTNWDFTNIWIIDEGNRYPILRTLPEPVSNNPQMIADIQWLTFDLIKGENEEEDDIRSNLVLPRLTLNNAIITWVSSDTSVLTNAGVVIRPEFDEAAADVTLTATFRHAFETGKVDFNLTIQPECPLDAQRPTINQQPADVFVLTDETAQLSVSASVSPGELSYQWYEHTEDGDIRIEDETASFYYAPTATTGARVYYVVITNTDPTATGSGTASTISDHAIVTVGARHDAEIPVITGYSSDFNVPIGGTVVLAVTAEVSRGDLTYQWYERTIDGDNPIWGANQPAFIAPTYELGQRQYFASVTNTDSMATGLQAVTTAGGIITVEINENALFYNVSLSVSGVHRFTDREEGYEYTEAESVFITNSGLEGVTGLNVTISGGDIGAFSITAPEQTSLYDDLSTYFTVTPNIGLPPRNYISIISVSGDNNVLVSFVASFTVAGEKDRPPDGGNEQPTEHTITATSGTGGTITPSGDVIVTSGENRNFTISPNSGYIVSDVLVDGISIGAVSNYTFINVTANHRIHAVFAVIENDNNNNNNNNGNNNAGGNFGGGGGGTTQQPPPSQAAQPAPQQTQPAETPEPEDDEPVVEITVNGQAISAQADEDGVFRFMLTEFTPNHRNEIIIVLQESEDEIYVHIPIAALETNDLIIIGQTMSQRSLGSLRLLNRTLSSLKQQHGDTLILSLNQNGGFEIRFE